MKNLFVISHFFFAISIAFAAGRNHVLSEFLLGFSPDNRSYAVGVMDLVMDLGDMTKAKNMTYVLSQKDIKICFRSLKDNEQQGECVILEGYQHLKAKSVQKQEEAFKYLETIQSHPNYVKEFFQKELQAKYKDWLLPLEWEVPGGFSSSIDCRDVGSDLNEGCRIEFSYYRKNDKRKEVYSSFYRPLYKGQDALDFSATIAEGMSVGSSSDKKYQCHQFYLKHSSAMYFGQVTKIICARL